MKRIAITTLLLLGLVAMAAAQTVTTLNPPATSNRKPPPAAKTAEEHTAYQAIAGNPDLAAAEAAAKDFASKYPQSELRSVVYSVLMTRYQQANNGDKTVEMGRKVLQFDPDHSIALVMTATLLAERTRDTDLDHDARFTEAMQDAQHALDTFDTGLVLRADVSDEQWKSAKATLSSMAQSAMGMVELKRKNPAEAEKHYRVAVALNAAQPDAVIFLRLALALDQQKKYAEALVAANRAVELSAATGGTVADMARQEQSRLYTLTGQKPPAPAPATPPKS
jgi:tetratricopeptide (TPR) repeat protein